MAREPESIAQQRRDLGERLAQFRRAAELTQAQLASILHYDRSTLAHIERGRSRADEQFWQQADEVCYASGSLLAGFHRLETAKAEWEQQVRVRELDTVQAKVEQYRAQQVGGYLQEVSYEPAQQIAAALDKPWRVGQPALDAVSGVLTATRQLEDQTSTAAVLPSVRNLVQIIDVYAAEARSAVRRETLALASELHCYAGWLQLNGKYIPQAAHDFDAAISLALEADSPDDLSHAASFKGNVALRAGKLSAAVSLSNISLRDTRTFLALRIFDGYQVGHAYALMHDRRSAEKSMQLADTMLDKAETAYAPSWAYWYKLPFLLTQRAIVHEALGETAKAIADLEAGLAEMPLEHRNAEWGREIRERLVRLEGNHPSW